MTLPITISDGDFSDPTTGVGSTPLAKIAVRFSEAVINTAWELGLAKATDANDKADALAAELAALIASPGGFHVTAGSVSLPTVTAPDVTIPSSIDVSSIMGTFDSKYLELATFLAGKFTDIITTYYPNEAALYGSAETWLTDAIADGGIPLAVQAQLLGDDHARIAADKLRAQDGVLALYAGRRFPLPPDVAASAVLQIEQKAQEEMASSSRKLAALTLDNMKTAIVHVKEMRQTALGAANEYVKSLASGPDVASRMTNIGYDAQSKLISSAAQFYGADTNAKEMISKVAQWNETIALDAATKNQVADLSLIESKVKALLTDLQSTMQQATALFNNLHASAGTTLSI